MRTSCPQWIDAPGETNCVLVLAEKGPHTLRELMKYFHQSFTTLHRLGDDVMRKVQRACDLHPAMRQAVNPLTGRPKHTSESRAKIAATLKGRKLSPETRKRISDANRRRFAADKEA